MLISTARGSRSVDITLFLRHPLPVPIGGPLQSKKLRVVVADDSTDFLQRLTSVLGAEFDVVATARDGRTALDLVAHHKPDLIVLDLCMPGLNGIQVAEEAARISPATRIVICSIETDLEIVEAAQRAGVLGYVFKSRIEKELHVALKTVAMGKFFASSLVSKTDDIALCQVLI